MDQQHQTSSNVPMNLVCSPTLEALCHDLDMFINELSVNSVSSKSLSINEFKNPKEETPLELDKYMSFQDDYYTNNTPAADQDEQGKTPGLESYTQFSEQGVPAAPAIDVPVILKVNHTPPISHSFLRVGHTSTSTSTSTSNSNSNSNNNSNNNSNSNSTSTSNSNNNNNNNNNNGGDYFRQSTDEYVFTTRSSSISRATSSSSGKSIVHLNNRVVPPSPNKPFLLNPTSPLAFEINTIEESVKEIPSYALLSFITNHLINAVALLNERRRTYCSAEYPLSFTGEEVINMIRTFSPPGLKDSVYLDVAQSLMYCQPALIIPIDSSEKSLRKKRIYNSQTEIYTLVEGALDEEIQGIYTPFTSCYSMSCLPGQPGCYSTFCPNKVDSLNGCVFKKPAAISFVSSSSHDTTLSRAWSASIAKDILKSMPDDEIKRQEAIHEVIYTEDDYVRDLKILDVDFAKELLASQSIEESRKQEFHDKVLNNYQQILGIHDALYKELRDYQAGCQATNGIGLVDKIGDIFLRHVHQFMHAYLKYGPHVVLAEYHARMESETNMVYRHFIKAREQLAQCRRLPFRHFIILPVTRLQRYSLLLSAVLKKTPDDNPDKQYLTDCIEVIKSVASKMDEGTVVTKNTLRIYEIDNRIRYKPDEPHNLDLLKPGRRLLQEGILTRKSHLAVETVELSVFLFDHLLLFTKAKKSSANENDIEYHVSKRPILMELLHMQEATEGFSMGMRNMKSTYSPQSGTTTTTLPSSSPFGVSYPILLSHLGRRGADYLLYTESAAARLQWKEKVVQAKAMLEMADLDKRVFEIRTLSDTTFAGPNHQPTHNHGKVTCTVPFTGPTGIRMIAVGTQHGIWMGLEGDTNTINLALAISDVQQIAVLEDHHIFLILSDKTLYAYSLDSLIPKDNTRKHSNDKPHQKIAQHISFFHSGICNGRTIIIAMKKRGVDSNFKVMEPVCGDLRNPKNSKFFAKSGLFSKMPSWFKIYMEFYIGTESYSMHFLKARVVVVCARGFEIINLEALNMNRNLPDMTNSEFGFVQQRGEDLRPLGMFRCREHYLLCYDAFAFMVNVHGGLVKDTQLIEWEGVPQSVAFYYPYVIGFDARFVEIRHVETGELIQVLAGTHMRCLQFINNTIAPVIHGCMAHPFKPEFQYIFQLTGTFEPPL